MNAKTLTALKGSIEKWEKIVAGTGIDCGTRNCPLCRLFVNDEFCGDCPVAFAAHDEGCLATPWTEWNEHQRGKHPIVDNRVHCPTCRRLARAELRFLKSLLPKVKK